MSYLTPDNTLTVSISIATAGVVGVALIISISACILKRFVMMFLFNFELHLCAGFSEIIYSCVLLKVLSY